MTILFLGNGFIANPLSATLADSKIEHRIVSKDLEDDPPAKVRADIGSLTENSSVFEGVGTVIYFAHSSVPYSSMQNILGEAEENILNAIRVFEILAKRRIRVIYISSGGSIYGHQNGPTSEQSLPSPVSAYGVSKYTIENYLKLFHHNYQLPYDILRLSNIYGIGQQNNRPQGIVCALAEAFLTREKFGIWGDGAAKKDYLYIGDAVDALMKVVLALPSNDTFNISCGRSTSILEIISLFEKVLGYSIRIEKRPAFDFDVQNTFLDNSKFTRTFDWRPMTSMEQGIERTIEWLASSRSQPMS